MDFNRITYGDPSSGLFNAVIEIPLGSSPVKYEFDKDSGALRVDRFLTTAMYYPGNYGFIPHTLSNDGDPCDVVLILSPALQPGCIIQVRPIGALIMEDERELDEKIIAVPSSAMTKTCDHINDISDLDPTLKEPIAHFFKHYKDLEKNKIVQIKDWIGRSQALELIQQSIERAQANVAS